MSPGTSLGERVREFFSRKNYFGSIDSSIITSSETFSFGRNKVFEGFNNSLGFGILTVCNKTSQEVHDKKYNTQI